MSSWVWIVIAVAVVAVALVAWMVIAQAQRQRLRRTFGPEYDRAVERGGDRREAEAELRGRVKRRRSIEIRPLEPGMRDRYADAWSRVQARFVDEPAEALRGADMLVIEVMTHCGYPMGGFDERAADISVDHPDVVEDYRNARDVSRAVDEGCASTEDMRRGMMDYRSLFARLLSAEPAQPQGVRR